MLGGSNAEKWGGNQKKKFSINNSVEAVISLKEKHEGLLKLDELFEGVGRREGGGVPVLPNIRGNVLKQILTHKFQYLIRGIQ